MEKYTCFTFHALFFLWQANGVFAEGATLFFNGRSNGSRVPDETAFEGKWNEGLTPVLDDPCVPRPVVPKNYTTCGDGYCRCNDTVADCSMNFGRLSYVPRLPGSISHLSFVLNRLTSVQRHDFFQNASSVITLNLSWNNLRYIVAGAFSPLKTLKALLLIGNELTLDELGPILSVRTLRLLDLSINPIFQLPDGIFDFKPPLILETLCLNVLRLNELNMSVFTPLQQLMYLQLVNNRLSRTALHTVYMPRLAALFLSINAFWYFLETCRNGESLFPNLVHLQLSSNSLSDMMFNTPVCMPSLKYLALQNNLFQQIGTEMFGPQRFPSLKAVNLTGSAEITAIEKHAFSNPALQNIFLGSCQIDFGSEKVDADIFSGSTNLKVLSLSHNDFSRVSEHKFKRLFNNVSKLSLLNMESTNLGYVTPGMFANLKHLEGIALDINRLTDIPDGTFDALTNLRWLGLSANQISSVRETTFSANICRRLEHLHLDNNPFMCSCDLRWFQSWLVSQPALFAVGDNNSYICDNVPGTTVQSFYMPDQACLLSPEAYKFIIAAVIILMIPLGLAALLYRYRWHIRLALYEMFRGRGDRRHRRLQERDFEYDVFVSFDRDDLNWVLAHLMPELEARLGLRLCIHERDFIPGKNIVDNIADCVEQSKKVMMLFSKSFAESPWCQFELNFCLTHVMEHDDMLVVVMLHEIPPRDLTTAMTAVMATTTYIKWVDQRDARAWFWDRIRITLNEILPRGR